MYIVLTIQISKEPASHLFLAPYSCNVPNVSKRFPSFVVHSFDCCICLLPFIFSETQYFSNLLPFTLSNKNHQSEHSTSQSSNWMISKTMSESLWSTSFAPTTQLAMYHVPAPHHTQRNWQVRLIVVSIQFLFEWTLLWLYKMNPSLHTIKISTMMMILIPFLETLAIQAGHDLLLQYTNFHITPTPPKFTITPALLASSTTTTSHVLPAPLPPKPL